MNFTFSPPNPSKLFGQPGVNLILTYFRTLHNKIWIQNTIQAFKFNNEI